MVLKENAAASRTGNHQPRDAVLAPWQTDTLRRIYWPETLSLLPKARDFFKYNYEGFRNI